MGHTLLGVLGLFLLNTLLYGHAEAGRRGVTLTADRTIIPLGGRVTLTCSVEDPAGFKYQWFRQTSDYSFKTPLQTENVDQSYRVISQGGKYTCRGWSSEPRVITPDSNAVVIEETGADAVLEVTEFTLFEGDLVTLRCKNRTSQRTMRATFYKDGSPLQNRNHQLSTAGEMTVRVSVSDEGRYKCQFADGTESEERELRVKAGRRRVTLTADRTIIPLGGRVTLTCSVEDPAGFKYEWSRQTSDYSVKTLLQTENLDDKFRVISKGGKYTCRGWRREPDVVTPESNEVIIEETVPNKAVVTLQPNWSEIHRGETITLRCEIKDGGDTDWEYEWRTTSSEKPSNQNELSIRSVSASHSGDYRCKGRKKREKSSTDWSDPFKLTVSDKPQSVLTVSPSWLSAGASVTLNCSVKDQSAGWRFYWYKTVPDPSDNSYSYELLPGSSSSGTEQDSYIVHGQTHTAGYVCRAGRGDPVYYTDYSQPQFVWSADFHSSASLTVSPDRAQHFTSDSVSLSCEGNSTEWRVKRLSPEDRYLSDCTAWGTMTGSTCKLKTYWRSAEVYWCESGSGEFSNTVNITIQAVSRPERSSFPVLLIVGLICGIVLIILLLLLYRYTPSKDTCFKRPIQSENSNTDHVVYQNEAQCDTYDSLLHGPQHIPEESIHSNVGTGAADGQGYKKIANTLKLRYSMVIKTIQRFNRTGSTQIRPRHGQPKKMSSRAQRHIQRLSLESRRMSAASIAAEVEGVGVSLSVLRPYTTLHQIGLHGCRPRRKPLLKMMHKKVRKQFAEDK
ncbi:Down syndrome cell adhesion molecule-like protein 1 homolog [Sparus aurata]|uniref:Down syndrome cell adhesion molecule-like protein 1 homolog n=1 Tax=Sparus aurata TaxID=8175 RepID=UPI0011C116AF|nr:Down syndrome cell adhesion molecule-like protein 1 homolog [Sparus aurata]